MGPGIGTRPHFPFQVSISPTGNVSAPRTGQPFRPYSRYLRWRSGRRRPCP
jgi:hypothetical protein